VFARLRGSLGTVRVDEPTAGAFFAVMRRILEISVQLHTSTILNVKSRSTLARFALPKSTLAYCREQCALGPIMLCNATLVHVPRARRATCVTVKPFVRRSRTVSVRS
jgi:hypothetical protein